MPTPNLPQGVVDPLNTTIQASTLLQQTAYNTVGGVVSSALPDAQADIEPTAEAENHKRAILKSFCDYVQGLTPITSLQIASFFKPPGYTTAGLPSAATAGERSLVYDTTVDRLKTSNGSAWVQYAITTEVSNGIRIIEDNGEVDQQNTTVFHFNGDYFDLSESGGAVTVNGFVAASIAYDRLANASARSAICRAANSVGSVAAVAGAGAGSILHDDGSTLAFRLLSALGLDQTLFTYATTAGPSATTTPTDILSQSIAASTLSADGQRLEVYLEGDDFNQSGIGITWEIAILLGGVEIYRDTTSSRASSTTRRPWRLRFAMTRLSSTTLYMAGSFESFTSATAPDTGLGDLTATATMDAPLSSAVTSPTVAWGSSQTLQVRITASINNANTDFTRRSGIIMRRAA